ncbi:hypothetical protein [Streptobacillus canis]|uniref:hypothetical protein n=1 Tax=Streptobacillus canis TaxID=2678686 RepID=UPI0012E25DF1|nr:hypothetical protein [Streptobacillus canis]
MKKVILLTSMLPLAAMASDKVFDFNNAKPFGGEVETNLTVSNEISAGYKTDIKNTMVKHDLAVKTDVYEFVTLGAKLGYGYKGTANGVYFDVESTEINAKADFKKYGNVGVAYEFGGKYGPAVRVKYANEGKINPVTVGGHVEYKHVFTPKVQIRDIFTGDMNIVDGEVYVSHNVNKDLKLTGKAGVNVEVGNEYLFDSKKLKKTRVNSDIRLGGKVDYTINPKVKLITDNELGIMINKIIVVNSSYDPSAELRFKSDNKVEVKAAKDLLVIPSFVLDSQKTETKLNTSVRVDYKILKGLNINGTVGFENEFKIEPDTNSQKYNSTTPYLQVGLSYTW